MCGWGSGGMNQEIGIDHIYTTVDASLSELRELVMDRGPGVLRFMGSQRVGHD